MRSARSRTMTNRTDGWRLCKLFLTPTNCYRKDHTGLSLESEQFVSRTIQWAPVANSMIAYRRFGKGDPLLLLHGWPLSSMTFRKLVPLLQDQFDCYVPDLPGCGQSEWSSKTDFSIAGR